MDNPYLHLLLHKYLSYLIPTSLQGGHLKGWPYLSYSMNYCLYSKNEKTFQCKE